MKRRIKYLAIVRKNIENSVGELKEFWLREERKTLAKIAKL
jgi:hypothetical protein